MAIIQEFETTKNIELNTFLLTNNSKRDIELDCKYI